MKTLITFAAFLISLSSVAAPTTGRYKTIVDRMQSVQTSNSDISSIFSIGANDDGVEIYAMRISTTPKSADPGKVAHLFVATHHGNELAAPQLTMAFVDDLIARYRSEELWRGNIADTEWVIVPVLNISGYNANQRREKGVDPNRDYPGPCPSGKTGKLKSIRQIMKYMDTRVFAGTVSVHGYVGSLTYPWGMHASGDATLDDNQYGNIVGKAAKHNGYRHGTHTAIVYPANGTYEDYTYWKYGMWTTLLELRDGSPQDIKDTVVTMATFFDLLNSTPSAKNQFKHSCNRYNGPDLRLE